MVEIKDILSKLKDKQYIAIVHSKEYKYLLKGISIRIVHKAKNAPNEATIESVFDCELFSFFREIFEPLGFEYYPQKEVSIATKRHIAKGRADTVIGALVIEFKQPSTLSSAKKQNKAVSQISDYLKGIDIKTDTDRIGFITDGTKGCFVTLSDGNIHTEPFTKISYVLLDRLVQNIIGLKLITLSSKNLVENFCNPPENDGVAFRLVKVLYSCLITNMIPRSKMLFNEWKELFNLAHDDISKQQAIIDRKKSLEQLLNVELEEKDKEYMALYALQTAYAIIIKIVAYRIISLVKYNKSLVDFENFINIDSNTLRIQMERLENGAIFRDYGITNLLEGDFFSWYCSLDQWTTSIAKNISNVFRILSMYSNKSVLNSETQSADFFKELYQAMIPSAVRHSLGEYYTKKWLANQVTVDALKEIKKTDWKGLDPCCGSGTFLTVMIDKVLEETKEMDLKKRLQKILTRVKGIDLNPIAVLTARVNYFINISPLLSDTDELEIPVYLGDSSYVPKNIIFDKVKCLKYTIHTLKEPIDILVPASMVENSTALFHTMTKIELFIKNKDEESTYECLANLVDPIDLTEDISLCLHKLSKALVNLERQHWDGIWPRIIANYLTTANLGRFDIIVSNPPWVDWKSLPSGYRDRIKNLCISKKLFSGDKLTGGINLNICALICNVAAENWLAKDGILGFLMPEPLIFQPSYEGFRNFFLSDGSRLYFQKFTNWTKAGHPFKPVTQKFLTFYIARKKVDYKLGVNVKWFDKKKGKNSDNIEILNIDDYFDSHISTLATCHQNKNIFSYVNKNQLSDFSTIAGTSYYIGREGIEFYPQELMIFTQSNLPALPGCTSLKNIQVKRSKYSVPQQDHLLETQYLNPLIKGVDISPFHVNISGYIVPFPYESNNPKIPISIDRLTKLAPRLAQFYIDNKQLILEQTSYNEKIIGNKGDFYSLARVGAYSFADNYVVFRDNTKWCAAVVSLIDTQWGGKKRPVFQNHAVSICQDKEGKYISNDEAHFICGIINTNTAHDYVISSSDSRSFPIRPRIYIPKYDSSNQIHKEIVALSKQAHFHFKDSELIKKITKKLDKLYITLSKQKNNNL